MGLNEFMKKNIDFTKLLLSMQDDTFFYIIRNYLGPLQTPFHKPTLIKELLKFLSKKSVQEKILLYIDRLDKKILTAVSLLLKTTIQDIYQLFQDEYEFFQLQQAVINLEERLLLLTAENNSQLQINPLFSDLIDNQVFDITMLLITAPTLKSSTIKESNQPNESIISSPAIFLMKPAFVIAILTYYYHNKFSILPDGKYKKKTEENILQYLGDISQSEQFLQACYLINHTFFTLGILKQTKTTEFILCDKFIHEDPGFLCSLTPFNFFVLSIINILSLPASSLSVQVISSFLTLFYRIGAHSFTELDIGRICTAAKLLHEANGNLRINEKDLFDLLLSYKVILKQDKESLIENNLCLYNINPDVKPLLNPVSVNNCQSKDIPPPEDKRVLMTIDSDYSIIIDTEIPTNIFFDLFPFIELRKIDTKYLFEITKNSFLKAMDSGKILDQFLAASKILTKMDVPSHILSSMKSWLDLYNRIDIYYGIIVKADPFLSRVIETHPEINNYVIEKLAKGVFLMDKENELLWRSVLNNSGIDFLPTTKSAESKESFSSQDASEDEITTVNDTGFFSEYIPAPKINPENLNPDLISEPNSEESITSVKNVLSEKLVTMNLSEKDLEEFRARIEKKLILVPEQLRGSPLHRTIWEAKGLDYQGKVNLCRNALKNGIDLVEIHLRKIDGTETVTLLRPISLENPGKDAVLRGTIVPDEIETEFTIRKIFLLRKLKSSLFSP